MNEEFMMMVEMVVFKMIAEGKISIQRTLNNTGEFQLSLNCVLKDDEYSDDMIRHTYVANPEGKFGIKLDDIE